MLVEKCFSVIVGGDVIASRMSLDTATLLAKAIFEEYNNGTAMRVTIERAEESESDCTPITVPSIIEDKPTI